MSKWLYMVGNLKKKRIVQKDQVKKKKRKEKGLKQKEKKNRSAIWALLCKVSGIDDIWKEKIVLH